MKHLAKVGSATQLLELFKEKSDFFMNQHYKTNPT